MKKIVSITAALMLLVGCASVDITKTAKGFYEASDPNALEILQTVPKRPYVELGTVVATNFNRHDTATMHNEIRNKAAPLGADAVVLSNVGVGENNKLWATGVAIKYTQPN